MTANAQAFMLTLCLLGLMAWVAIIIGFALVALMRKIIGWIVTR